jgi:hypothetical protein
LQQHSQQQLHLFILLLAPHMMVRAWLAPHMMVRAPQGAAAALPLLMPILLLPLVLQLLLLKLLPQIRMLPELWRSSLELHLQDILSNVWLVHTGMKSVLFPLLFWASSCIICLGCSTHSTGKSACCR